MKWTQPAADCESLAAALAAVLSERGADVSPEQVGFELGLGLAMVAAGDRSVREWRHLARDAALVETAALHGLRLRDMHPPEAAVGLESSAEFPQHFEDSYAPLIRRALENGQLVLAWGGWPSPAEYDWGVIHAQRGADRFGFVSGCGPHEVRHAGSSPQVYVVEAYEPRVPSAGETFNHAVRAALRFRDGSLAASHGVLSGGEAYALWAEAIRRMAAAPSSSLLEHVELCRGLRSARFGAVKSCESLRAQLAEPVASLARDWARAAETAARALGDALDRERTEMPCDSQSLLRRVRAADQIDGEAAASLRRFVRGIG